MQRLRLLDHASPLPKGFDQGLGKDELKVFLLKKAVAAAKDSFPAFMRLFAPLAIPEEFKDGRHLDLIARELQLLMETPAGRLMVALAPGSMKSRLCSVLWPCFILGHHPNWQILQVSHSVTLAEVFGRQVRNIIMSPEYQMVFPGTQVKKDSWAAARWSTTAGGEYLGAGAGAQIAGFRGNVIILDDVVSEQTAFSKTELEKIIDWYSHGLRTRLLPGGKVVNVQCLAGDTPVTMADGSWKRLDSVQAGEVIKAFEGGELVDKAVIGARSSGVDEVFEVRTGNSRIVGNARHPILCETGWKLLGELTLRDKVALASKLNFSSNPRLSLDQAWLLGFMFGDGWVTTSGGRTRKQRWVTCVAKGTCPEINAHVLATFLKLWGKAPKETKFGYYRFEVAAVGKWLVEHGITGGAKGKRLPKWLYSQPEAVRERFLAGMIDADGCVGSDYRVTIGLANLDLIEDFRHLVRGLGYRASNVHVSRTLERPPHSKIEFEAIAARFSWFYSNKYPEPVLFRKVRSIRAMGKQEVFDLQVDGAESFLADGVVVHNTRWVVNDLTGHLLKRAKLSKKADQWKSIKIPAILDEESAKLLGLPEGGSYWPEHWSLEELLKTKDPANTPPSQWAALYMQSPIADGGNIFKADHFSDWEAEDPPNIQYKLMSCDTAYSEKEENDYSALTMWGIFNVDDPHRAVEPNPGIPNMILLGYQKGRWGFPDLVRRIRWMYERHKPDCILIEDRSSGISLLQELRRQGLPVRAWKTNKDKVARAHSCTPLVETGRIWLPKRKNWAGELLTELEEFPKGEHDDGVDATTQAILWMRQSWMTHPDDPRYEEQPVKKRSRGYWAWRA